MIAGLANDDPGAAAMHMARAVMAMARRVVSAAAAIAVTTMIAAMTVIAMVAAADLNADALCRSGSGRHGNVEKASCSQHRELLDHNDMSLSRFQNVAGQVGDVTMVPI